jgi:hypothetical protein
VPGFLDSHAAYGEAEISGDSVYWLVRIAVGPGQGDRPAPTVLAATKKSGCAAS